VNKVFQHTYKRTTTHTHIRTDKRSHNYTINTTMQPMGSWWQKCSSTVENDFMLDRIVPSSTQS